MLVTLVAGDLAAPHGHAVGLAIPGVCRYALGPAVTTSRTSSSDSALGTGIAAASSTDGGQAPPQRVRHPTRHRRAHHGHVRRLSHQVLRHQSFRGEIASLRLCHLVRCSFAIPLSREAWIPEDDFRALVGADAHDDLRFGTSRRLIFFDEPTGPALYGVVKAWVPDFTRFPVEYVDVWEPLVTAGVTREELESTTVAEAIAPFADRPRGFYREIVARSDGMTAYDLARQLSALHVFDLLINNFDRYQPVWFGNEIGASGIGTRRAPTAFRDQRRHEKTRCRRQSAGAQPRAPVI